VAGRATIRVTEVVRDISGKLKEKDESQSGDDDGTEPINWANGVYDVTLKKDKLTGSWRINDMEMVETVIVDEDLRPSATPEASAPQGDAPPASGAEPEQEDAGGPDGQDTE
jgi:hypothetical protein